MALTRKGARRITVDDVVYRWTVRRKPTYCQALGWSPLTFAVERTEQPGSTLVVSLPWARPDNWLALPSGPVRPGVVARAIRVALSRGWQSASPGSPFKIDLPSDE